MKPVLPVNIVESQVFAEIYLEFPIEGASRFGHSILIESFPKIIVYALNGLSLNKRQSLLNPYKV